MKNKYKKIVELLNILLSLGGTVAGVIVFFDFRADFGVNPFWFTLKLILFVSVIIAAILVGKSFIDELRLPTLICDGFPNQERLCSVLAGKIYKDHKAGETTDGIGSENHELIKLDTYENFIATAGETTIKAQDQITMTLPYSPYEVIEGEDYDTFETNLAKAHSAKVKHKIKLISLSNNEYRKFITSLSKEIDEGTDNIIQYINSHCITGSKFILKWRKSDANLQEFIVIDEQVALKYCDAKITEPLNQRSNSVIYFDFDQKVMKELNVHFDKGKLTKNFFRLIKKDNMFYDICCWVKFYKGKTFAEYEEEKKNNLTIVGQKINDNKRDWESKLENIISSCTC